MEPFAIAAVVLVIIVALFLALGSALKSFNAKKGKSDLSQDAATDGQDTDDGNEAGDDSDEG